MSGEKPNTVFIQFNKRSIALASLRLHDLKVITKRVRSEIGNRPVIFVRRLKEQLDPLVDEILIDVTHGLLLPKMGHRDEQNLRHKLRAALKNHLVSIAKATKNSKTAKSRRKLSVT